MRTPVSRRETRWIAEVAHALVRAASRLVSTPCWRMHSAPGVARSGDAARTSACATSSLGGFFCASAAVLAAAMLTGLLIPAGVNAQSAKIPRTSDGKPDFSGTFEWPKSIGGPTCKCSATIFDKSKFAPLKSGGEPFFEARTGDPQHDEPREFCMPAGFPSGMLSANAVQMVQNKNYLVIVHEFQRMTRIVPMDGRPHREGLEPMFYGDPVGHWEGDTLVVETTNFKRWGLDDYYYTEPKEYRMHSEALRTIEHIKWKDASTVSYQLTIDDPKIFEGAWTQDFEMKARPDWDKMGLFEYICEENNRCPGGRCKAP